MENLSEDQQNILNNFKQFNRTKGGVKVKVILDHPMIKEVFPLGFETEYIVSLTTEDITHKGFWTRHHVLDKTKGGKEIMVKKDVYVEDKTIPKGTFKDILFLGLNNEFYSGDWFHKCTGKSISTFFEKIVE